MDVDAAAHQLFTDADISISSDMDASVIGTPPSGDALTILDKEIKAADVQLQLLLKRLKDNKRNQFVKKQLKRVEGERRDLVNERKAFVRDRAKSMHRKSDSRSSSKIGTKAVAVASKPTKDRLARPTLTTHLQMTTADKLIDTPIERLLMEANPQVPQQASKDEMSFPDGDAGTGKAATTGLINVYTAGILALMLMLAWNRFIQVKIMIAVVSTLLALSLLVLWLT